MAYLPTFTRTFLSQTPQWLQFKNVKIAAKIKEDQDLHDITVIINQFI